MQKNIFWDYKSLQTTNKSARIAELGRKIMFGAWVDDDIDDIFKHFHSISMTEYWKYYFTLYFKKYGPHGHSEDLSRLAR